MIIITKSKNPTEPEENDQANEAPQEVIVIGLDLLLTGIDRIHKVLISLQKSITKLYTLFEEEIKREQ